MRQALEGRQMPHRTHLFSLRIGHAVRESCFAEPYSFPRFRKDLLAGLTVGIIAIPLAMALAIASGVPPQYGLYTAAIAGFVIALTGGSRFSISGPTAAFVVILYPITQKYGLSGLLLANLMAGALLVLMALFRLGRFIEYIPEPVTLGFTGGIGVVIATLQIKDFFGLTIEEMPEHYSDKVITLAQHLPDLHWPSLLVAMVTLGTMRLWPRLKSPVPAHLPAILVASLLALALNDAGMDIATIDSRFTFITSDGSTGHGIPPFLPGFEWPWMQMDAKGKPLTPSWALAHDLLPAAFAIAMLGAIESLLCAVVMDGMTGKRHSANSELLGQGIGNLITPFFGGITATAAIARSTANFKAGAETPVAGMVHAVVVMLGLVSFAPLLGYLPMPAMAALLLVVAWNMSEAPKSIHLFKTSQSSDRWIFLTCFTLTVLFDMVIAITTGTLLAAVLFMKSIADSTRAIDITDNKQYIANPLPQHWHAFKITGPLFFAAADKIFGELARHCMPGRGLVLYLDNTTLLDAGGVAALTKLISHCHKTGAQLILTDVQRQPLRALAKARLEPIEGVFRLYPDLQTALSIIERNQPAT
jgi:sulfate permease, SulP family